MASLRTDYQDDVLSGNRKYRMINNSDGTVSFVDVTNYTQEGDTFGALDINATNTEVNALQEANGDTDISGIGDGTNTGAISALNTGKVGTGDTIAVAHGGTGATTVAGARNALGLGNTSGAVPVANGGTGATTAANARTNLGVAYGSSAGTVCQGNDSRLSDKRIPTSHADTSTTYGVGTQTVYGHVKLTDQVRSDWSTNSGWATTPAAVYNVVRCVWQSSTGEIKKPLHIRVVDVSVSHNSTATARFSAFPTGVLFAFATPHQPNFGGTSTVNINSVSNGSAVVYQWNSASAALNCQVVVFGY